MGTLLFSLHISKARNLLVATPSAELRMFCNLTIARLAEVYSLVDGVACNPHIDGAEGDKGDEEQDQRPAQGCGNDGNHPQIVGTKAVNLGMMLILQALDVIIFLVDDVL